MTKRIAFCIAFHLQALDTFNTAIVSPIYYVMFTSLTILASVIMFKVPSSPTKCIYGCIRLLLQYMNQITGFMNRTGIGKTVLKLSQKCVDLSQYFQALFFSTEQRTWSRVRSLISFMALLMHLCSFSILEDTFFCI